MPNQVPPTGVLLLQLGTPDDASVPAVRRYLAEFLATLPGPIVLVGQNH